MNKYWVDIANTFINFDFADISTVRLRGIAFSAHKVKQHKPPLSGNHGIKNLLIKNG